MNQETRPQSRREFWRDHIERSQNENGSDRAYCEMHGLSAATFSNYKKKLGFTPKKKRPNRNEFVQVETKLAVSEGARTLPDARWLAEFVIAIDRQQ